MLETENWWSVMMNDFKATWKRVGETDDPYCVIIDGGDPHGFDTLEEVFAYLVGSIKEGNRAFEVYEWDDEYADVSSLLSGRFDPQAKRFTIDRVHKEKRRHVIAFLQGWPD